jgi:hypothetical protein
VPDYIQYQDQHNELNIITDRITNLVDQCRRNGVYDASIPELKEVCQQDDGVFVAVENYSAVVDKGGVQNAIYEMPIEGIAKVLGHLYSQREQCKTAIYEITGIGDIIRGTSDPNETATAQQIKDDYANSRVGPAQREIQRYARDLLRLKAEIMAEHFSEDTFKAMTGLQMPATKDEAMQLAQQGAPPPPSWEEVMDLFRNDRLRSFRIDIETDSTLVIDDAADRKALSDTVQAMGFTLQSLAGAVKEKAISFEAANEIFMGVVRQTGFGHRVEEAIEANPAQPPKEEDPSQQMMMEAQKDMALEKLRGVNAKEVATLNAQKEIKLRELDQQGKEKMEFIKGQVGADIGGGKVTTFAEAFQALGGILNQQAQSIMAMQQQTAQQSEVITALFSRLTAPKRLLYDDAGNLAGREIVGFGVEPVVRDPGGRIIGTEKVN